MLSGKNIALGVTGGIAAYKIPNVASALRKAGAEVHVVMTQNATQFITPLTFESLTNHRCVVDTFARDFQYYITHISLATAADLILVDLSAPNLIHCHDPVEDLVFSAHGSNVEMNMARGQVIYEKGEFFTLDLERIRYEVAHYALPKIFPQA